MTEWGAQSHEHTRANIVNKNEIIHHKLIIFMWTTHTHEIIQYSSNACLPYWRMYCNCSTVNLFRLARIDIKCTRDVSNVIDKTWPYMSLLIMCSIRIEKFKFTIKYFDHGLKLTCDCMKNARRNKYNLKDRKKLSNNADGNYFLLFSW